MLFALLVGVLQLVSCEQQWFEQLCKHGSYQRKEYRDMSPSQWNSFRSALLQLQNTQSIDGRNITEWDRMTNIHIVHGHKYHGYYNNIVIDRHV